MDALVRSSRGRQPSGPIVLLILDGVGEGNHGEFDCVYLARTPNLDSLRLRGISTLLSASGPAVGLLKQSDMGNSEVGHNTMGAGRVFDQGAKLIDAAFGSASIWSNAWQEIVDRVKSNHSTLHLVGLLSHGRVHSDSEHLYRILERACSDDIRRIRIHVLLDGRDVQDHQAHQDVAALEVILENYRHRGFDYLIASGGGRMVTTMDRYGADWRVVEAGWRAHVVGEAQPFPSAGAAIESTREKIAGISDQKLPAFTVVDLEGRPVGPVMDGDVVLVFDFRGDRVVEFCRALAEDDFEHFDRGSRPHVLLVSMTQYERESKFPEKYLVEPPRIHGTVSELLCNAGVPQFACAETQKFGHVTYFWNGNRSEPFNADLEMYLEIASDSVPFDERPWMKSAETADALNDQLLNGHYDFLRVNFAGGDMVGHTANLDATIIAIEAIDLAIGRIAKVVDHLKGCLVVTADHGNAEDKVEMENGEIKRDPSRSPILKTAHSVNKVPFIVVDFGDRKFEIDESVDDPGLANIASTLLELLGFQAPTIYEPGLVRFGANDCSCDT